MQISGDKALQIIGQLQVELTLLREAYAADAARLRDALDAAAADAAALRRELAIIRDVVHAGADADAHADAHAANGHAGG